jgi:hypothetical protein
MASQKKVFVGGVAVELVAQNESRTLLTIQNISGVDIYYGDSTVTIANGQLLRAGATIREERTIENDPYFYIGATYAICAGSADIRVWDKERVR